MSSLLSWQNSLFHHSRHIIELMPKTNCWSMFLVGKRKKLELTILKKTGEKLEHHKKTRYNRTEHKNEGYNKQLVVSPEIPRILSKR